jgi:hypothetical protein
MGTSLSMIDCHYGHLARGGREHAIRLLDTYADIKARRPSLGRPMDAAAADRRRGRQRNMG